MQSNLVLVPVLVQDSKRNVLYGLKASQFVVKDNGIEQTIHMEDGEEVKLGGITLVARKTPGHTRGCTTWTWRVADGGKDHHTERRHAPAPSFHAL